MNFELSFFVSLPGPSAIILLCELTCLSHMLKRRFWKIQESFLPSLLAPSSVCLVCSTWSKTILKIPKFFKACFSSVTKLHLNRSSCGLCRSSCRVVMSPWENLSTYFTCSHRSDAFQLHRMPACWLTTSNWQFVLLITPRLQCLVAGLPRVYRLRPSSQRWLVKLGANSQVMGEFVLCSVPSCSGD